MKNNAKAQMWFTDFVIGILIFSFMLIVYYTYTANISKQNSIVVEDLIADGESISSSLLLAGYPNDWNSANVQSIGITNNNQRINNTKFTELMGVGYNKSKKLFGTVYDYVLFFVNESDDIKNIEGFCGTGNPLVIFTYEINAAYYYRGPGEEEYLKSLMENEFDADIYREDGTPGVDDLSALISRINNYGVVVMESPELSTSNFNDFKAAAEPYVNIGGFLMFGGQLLAAQGKTITGVTFYKKSGLSESDRLTTVVREDEFLTFEERNNVIFTQAYYVENSSATDFKDIARFNETDIEFEDILDNKIAIARWTYGEGKVLFFSDFDADYFAGDFQENLEASTQKWVGARCLPVNLGVIDMKNLVRIERLLIYDSKPIKMVLYLWR